MELIFLVLILAFLVPILAILFVSLLALNNLASIRKYTLAQFHLQIELSGMSDDRKRSLCEEYGLRIRDDKSKDAAG